MTRDEAYIAACDRVNKARPLHDHEVDRLIDALHSARQHREWTTGQVRRVRAALAQGMTHSEAGRLIGRSRYAVDYAVRTFPDMPRSPRGRRRAA